MLLPYVAVGIAMAVSSVELFQTGGTEAFVAWTRTLIVVLMMGRQCLTLLENLSLTRHLEARVDDRTAELRASEQRFEALVQHSSDVVTIVDVYGERALPERVGPESLRLHARLGDRHAR